MDCVEKKANEINETMWYDVNWLFVGAGGAAGAVFRFLLSRFVSQKSNTTFPVGTFIVNISGALLLGVLTGANTGSNVYLLMGEGFLGAYTTFSTLTFEGFGLFQDGERRKALVYIAGTFLLGIAAYTAGFASVKWFKSFL